ncbi:MAG: hypothetical protein ABIT05_16135 [Chitinophagaceae bacterium]
MKNSQQMTTLTEVLEKLASRKQDREFKMMEKGFTIDQEKYYEPADLTIIKVYRFEGESDPSDNAILYLIEAPHGIIGYSLDAYGAFSNHNENYEEFIRKIKVDERDEQVLFGELE